MTKADGIIQSDRMVDVVRIPVSPAAVSHFKSHNADYRELLMAATDFRVFLRHWKFLDQETGTQRELGNVLWAGQDAAVASFVEHPRVWELKARKLGLSTLEIAYDAWCARFRDTNARVHLYSRRDDAAMELLAAVRYGLERLPEWMQLPLVDMTDHEVTMFAGPDDRRLVKAYPASPNTAVEATCTHGHVDELDRMPFASKTWQAIEPTMAGSAHIVTTINGPSTFCAGFWRKAVTGDTEYFPLFVDALKRPGRDIAWWKKRVSSFGETETRREYPLRWEDALFGGTDFVFAGADLDFAQQDARGPQGAHDGFTYAVGWDIGRHKDASVGIVLEADSEDMVDVVHYERHRDTTYPVQQQRVKYLHEVYGATSVEGNNAGEAVIENLDLPEGAVNKFTTSAKSKARIIAQLALAFQNQMLRYDALKWPELDAELRSYQWDDKTLVQDSVMALAIALDHIPEASKTHAPKSRIPRIGTW